MSTHKWLLPTIVLVVVMLVGAGAWYARAENDDSSAATTSEETTQIENPVVSAIPYREETEYEPDPFEPDRIRRTQTEVKEIIIVRADGTIEHKRAW